MSAACCHEGEVVAGTGRNESKRERAKQFFLSPAPWQKLASAFFLRLEKGDCENPGQAGEEPIGNVFKNESLLISMIDRDRHP